MKIACSSAAADTIMRYESEIVRHVNSESIMMTKCKVLVHYKHFEATSPHST